MPAKRITYEAFWEKVDFTDGCWFWTGYINPDGYGSFHDGDSKKVVKAHVYAFQQYLGPVEFGKELHHTCEVRYCVNPDHLQEIAHFDHLKLKAKQFCPNGHEYTEENSYWWGNNRKCKSCRRTNNRASYYKYHEDRKRKMREAHAAKHNEDIIILRKPC